MSPAEERLAEALAVERMHGELAPAFVASRIGALAAANDAAGVARWKAIAEQLERLRTGDGRSQ